MTYFAVHSLEQLEIVEGRSMAFARLCNDSHPTLIHYKEEKTYIEICRAFIFLFVFFFIILEVVQFYRVMKHFITMIFPTIRYILFQTGYQRYFQSFTNIMDWLVYIPAIVLASNMQNAHAVSLS